MREEKMREDEPGLAPTDQVRDGQRDVEQR